MMTKAAVERVTRTVVERVESKVLVSALTADVILAELEAAYRVAETSGKTVNWKYRTLAGEKRFMQEAGGRKCFWNAD
jgi:hypothetical protein